MNWIKNKLLILVLTGVTTVTFAQHTRFTFNTSAGMNRIWSSRINRPGISLTSSVTFTPHRLLIIEIENERGTLDGKNMIYSENRPLVEANFGTTYSYWGGNAGVNLLKLFAPGKKTFKVIPYLYGGIGYLDFDAERYAGVKGSAVTKRYRYNVYTSKIGLRLRVKINHQFDVITAIETTRPESFYIDANPVPAAYDMYTALKVGLSYKIASRPHHRHIDWQAGMNTGAGKCVDRFY